MFDFETLGLIGLFISCFLAATILPFSSELILTSFVMSQTYSITLIVMIAIFGNSLGGLTNYLLGYFGNKAFLNKYKSNSKHQKINSWVENYGLYCAFFSWIPFIGDPLLIALGFYKSKFIPTTLLMILGKSLRYILLVYFLI